MQENILNEDDSNRPDEREKNRGTQTISQQSINIDEKGVDRTLSIANIASQIDGVTFISTGSNVERPVIHGLYGNRILVLNNYLDWYYIYKYNRMFWLYLSNLY